MTDLKTQELVAAVSAFLGAFETVFHSDWDFTRVQLESGGVCAQDATFLEPNVDDEHNNWANRGNLLEAYRTLRSKMPVAETCPCCGQRVDE